MRADRHWPDVYFGRPGELVTLPWPRNNIETGYDRSVAEFITGSGRRRVAKMRDGARIYTLAWNALTLDTYSRIEMYDRGHMGIGPWALIDPSRGNLLSSNQSSATTVNRNVEGFYTDATNHGTPEVNTDVTRIHRPGAPSNLRWHFTVSPTTFPILWFDTIYPAWHGIPVTSAQPYTFSCYVAADGIADSAMTVAAKVDWHNAAGTLVGVEATSGDTAITASWTRLVCTATPPLGAAYAVPRLVAVGSTINLGSSIYVDEPQFEMGSSANIWVPGTGVYPVETVEFSENIPFAAAWRDGPTLILREVVG